MEHALEGAQLLLWGSILLIVTLIVGICLVYVYVSKGGGMTLVGSQHSRSSTTGREELTLQLLPSDERAIYRRLIDGGGQVLQKDLRRMVSFSGPKITRVLDRLESKGLVVRERRGMTNLVRLRESEA